MKKLFCGIVCGICATCNAYAGLIPTSASAAASMGPGADCYSGDISMLKIAKVDCVTWNGSRLFEGTWSDAAWEECDPIAEYDGLCYLGEYGGAHYFCYDGGTKLCPEAGCESGPTNWTTYSSSAHTVTRQYQTLTDDEYYICTGTRATQYGCGSYSYLSGGSTTMTSTNLTCSTCPSAGGNIIGTSSDGNRSNITACYMQSGNPFADSTGNGVFRAKCYYTN